MISILKFISWLFQFQNPLHTRVKTFKGISKIKSKNKWLYPEDNFGTLKRGVE